MSRAAIEFIPNGPVVSVAQIREAFSTFGQHGTKAMFHHPPGYLAQFQRPALHQPRTAAADDPQPRRHSQLP